MGTAAGNSGVPLDSFDPVPAETCRPPALPPAIPASTREPRGGFPYSRAIVRSRQSRLARDASRQVLAQVNHHLVAVASGAGRLVARQVAVGQRYQLTDFTC
jgi:hypothetical protein